MIAESTLPTDGTWYCKKRTYPTKQDAENEANRLAALYNTKPMRVYGCQNCGCWHLTSDNSPARKLPKGKQFAGVPISDGKHEPVIQDWFRVNSKWIKRGGGGKRVPKMKGKL